MCLSLVASEHGRIGDLAYRNDEAYGLVTTQALSGNDIAFEITDKDRGPIRFQLSAVGTNLAGEAITNSRSEPSKLEQQRFTARLCFRCVFYRVASLTQT